MLSAAQDWSEVPLRVATACSGCDMIVVCLEMLKQVVRAQFGEEFATVHVFSVEKDDAKRAFLKVQFPAAGAIFCDVREIGKSYGVGRFVGVASRRRGLRLVRSKLFVHIAEPPQAR